MFIGLGLPLSLPRPAAGAAIYMFDMTAGSLPANAGLTRASGGTYTDASGVLQDAAVDAPRFDHDPTTLALRGLLFEPQRQQRTINSTAAGAVAGTGGTNPTGWVVSTTSNGMTKSIVGTGTEDGRPYVDIRWAGTITGGSNTITYFNQGTDTVTAQGEEIIGRVNVGVVDGSLVGISKHQLRIVERTAAGAFTGSAYGVVDFTPTTAALRTQRYEVAHTIVAADCERTQLGHRFEYSVGAVIDVTFRYSLPQVEATHVGTSAIKTSGAAATRQADALTLTVPDGTYDITYTLGTVDAGGTEYSLTDTVANGSYTVYLPAEALVAGERHIRSILMVQTEAGAADLVMPWDFEAILDDRDGDTATNTGSAAGSPPVYTISLASKATWDVNADAIAAYATSYTQQGRTNTTNASNCRNLIFDIANHDYWRINASTVFVDGSAKDYYAQRNWATIMLAFAYLKTKGASAWSAGDRTTTETWFSGIGDDILWYHDWQTSTLGSKHNNHGGFAALAAMLISVVTNRRDLFEWAVAFQRHILRDTFSDPVKEDSVFRPMCGYDPDPSNPLPARGILMLDLDRASSSTVHNGVFYNWYHMSNMAITALIARANGVNLLTETVGTGDWSGILSAYKAICDDGGAAVWAFIAANDVDNTASNVSALDVATHKVSYKIAGIRYLTALPEFSAHAAAATIDANLAGKDNEQMGGDIDYLRGYLT